jgi:hypothetical protein
MVGAFIPGESGIVIPPLPTGPVIARVLMVAGGGGGGYNHVGGGGGAGEVLELSSLELTDTETYTAAIGGGGAGGSADSAGVGVVGGDTSFAGISVNGGGGASWVSTGQQATAGGSGGGGAGGAPGGASVKTGGGLGFPGANDCGGGGGAGGIGQLSPNGYTTGGAGGPGINSDITGSTVGYGGGGGAGANGGPGGSASHGGAVGGASSAGNNAVANRGGGGGGGSGNFGANGGNGGSGIIVVRYAGASRFSGGIVTTVGGDTVHTLLESENLVGLGTTSGVQEPIPAGRIAPITTTYYGTEPEVPQAYFDAVAAQQADPILHPHMGSFGATAIKSGRWSDPTTWLAGVVPAAGMNVNVSSYEVIYDAFSDTLIKGIHVGGAGTFRVDPTVRTRLRIGTMMNHGTTVIGEKDALMPDGPAGGQANCEIIFHKQGIDPGVNVNFGWNTMGPVRVACTPKTAQIDTASRLIPIGATSCVIPGIAAANWRVGDEIVIPATDYDPPSLTDATYEGPTQYWNDKFPGTVGGFQQFYADGGFFQSQEERRFITAIDLATETVSWSGGLIHKHEGYLNTIQRMSEAGEIEDLVVDIKPRVVMLSRHVQMRTASPNNASDFAVDPALGNLKEVLNRAHCMWMHSDSIEIDSIRFTDMGRSFIDPSMVEPGWTPHTATQDGAVITNSVNVQGRYACHFHWTGPYIGRKVVRATNLVVDSSPNEIPTPGWAITHHASHVFLEDCVTLRTRGAGFATELGNETGHWVNCTSMHNIGDGFPPVLEGRSETWRGHNGHHGVGFECQARNVQMIGCLATSSHTAYHWQIQIDSYLDRVVQDISVRYRNPVSQGGDSSDSGPPDQFAPGSWNVYGRAQPQIVPAIGNMAWGCGKHMVVIHRGPQRQDDTPMVWKQCHGLNIGQAAAFGPYANSYFIYDSVFVGKNDNVAVVLSNVSWRWWFVSNHFENFTAEFQDAGALVNFEGFFVNNTRDNGEEVRLNSIGYQTFANDVVTYPWFNIMGDMLVDPSNPKRAVVRWWRNHTFDDFPTPYPLAPYGRHLDGSYPVVPLGGDPYFVDVSPPGQTWVGGDVRNQMIIEVIMRTSAGDRLLGNFMTAETWPAGAVVKDGLHTSKMTAEQAIIRNGCYRVAGNWFVRLPFPQVSPLEGKMWGVLVDRPVNPAAFAPGFLVAHEIANIDDVDYGFDTFLLPEALPPITTVS